MKVPTTFQDREVCIIGLGYVGLTLAVTMAEVGFRVHGVERVESVRRAVRCGRAHFRETGLDPRLATQVQNGQLSAEEGLTFGDTRPTCYIVTVGTPLAPGAKHTNLEPIRSVSESLSAVLREDDLVVLRSTVRIGVTRDIVKPILDKAGVQYDLAFCPERTLEGRALEELRTLPQIVGGETERATIRAAQVFSFLTPTTIKVASLETAEMIKLVNNTQRDLMFAFANEIAHVCDSVGVIASDVIKAGNMGYARASMPMPGPVGGPCLEKDPYILSEGVEMRNGSTPMALLGRAVNEGLPAETVRKICDYWAARGGLPKNMKVSICGLAFKGRPETSDLRGTMAIPLIAALKAALPGVTVTGFDPAVFEEEAETLGIEMTDTIEDAFAGAHICIFQTNHPYFETIRFAKLSGLMAKDGLVYDYWNQFVPAHQTFDNGVNYASLGGWAHIGSIV